MTHRKAPSTITLWSPVIILLFIMAELVFYFTHTRDDTSVMKRKKKKKKKAPTVYRYALYVRETKGNRHGRK